MRPYKGRESSQTTRECPEIDRSPDDSFARAVSRMAIGTRSVSADTTLGRASSRDLQVPSKPSAKMRSPSTVSMSVAVLSLGSGSSYPGGGVTAALLSTIPLAPDITFASIV
jgi:hypothetical protein